MTWTAQPQAGAYAVYVAKDPSFTNVYRIYETGQTSLTPRESWLDSQAGQSYYWFVRPCVDWAMTHCGPGPESYGPSQSSAYKKSSPPQNGLFTTTANNPPVLATTIQYQVTFNWADYMTTSQASPYPVTDPVPANSTRVTQEARRYTIQVSTTSDFSNIIDKRTVDQTQYTPWSITYPEGPLYWRVQALDGSDNPLTMSATGTVNKASPPITLTSPADTATVSGVPYFTWVPQNWAAHYTIEVYRNGDLNFSAANRIFSQTTSIAAWSPTANMPAGVYSWRVQRLDASNLQGPWSTGRTFTLHPSPPALNTPADLAQLDGANLYFTWLGVQGAVGYQFQSSAVADFSSLTENQTTVMTAWSPIGQYSPGVYFWRVNLLDASSNVLATSNSRSFTVGTMPGAPTGATATAGNTTATISWTAPTSFGSSPITGYIVTSTPGGKTCTSTGATHCTVGGLTNGSSYTFAVQAITAFGTGPASPDSNSVVPSSMGALVVSGLSSPRTAGTTGSIRVTAVDAYGNRVHGYLGTIHFTSTDTKAKLPASYTFTAADAGTHVFSGAVILKTAGTQSVTATDMVTKTIKGSQAGIVVKAAAVKTLVVSGLSSPRTAGSTGSIRVTVVDAYGNRIHSYTGTVHFTSTDTKAKLPANYKFTAADAGTHIFSVTLKTAGTQSVTATDTVTKTIKGAQAGIVVKAAAVKTLTVSGLTTPRTKGVAGTIRVTAVDAYGNRVSSYTGTIHFTSSDAKAKLPANYKFKATDAGTHVFTVTLKTAGTRSVTATDTVTKTIKGSQSGIVVH
jgi:NifU-like protein involved in Fe-S cluster formation